MTRYKLVDILPETLTNQFDFSATYTPEGGSAQSFTIFNTLLFVQEVEQHFTDREIMLGDTTPTADLLALFTRWKSSRSDAYARRAYALSLKYAPLDNYDRYEEKYDSENDTTYGHVITTTHTNDQTERSYTNYKETNTKNGEVKTANSIYGVNSVTAVPSDESTETYTNLEDERKVSGSYTDEHTGSVEDKHSGKDTTSDNYKIRAHGNIGVMSSAQLLEEDRRLAAYDLSLVAICDFIDRYTFYSEGLEL